MGWSPKDHKFPVKRRYTRTGGLMGKKLGIGWEKKKEPSYVATKVYVDKPETTLMNIKME